jgi:LIM homeobox protein 2/9
MLKERDPMGPTAASPCPSADAAVCDGCRGRITDRYYLVTVDRQWHSACLKCCECKLALHTQVSCFVKDGNIYCKEDFYR